MPSPSPPPPPPQVFFSGIALNITNASVHSDFPKLKISTDLDIDCLEFNLVCFFSSFLVSNQFFVYIEIKISRVLNAAIIGCQNWRVQGSTLLF